MFLYHNTFKQNGYKSLNDKQNRIPNKERASISHRFLLRDNQMNGTNLWERYCSFYEKEFSEQLEVNEKRMGRYFHRWLSTDFAKRVCQGTVEKRHDVPITTYEDYPMLVEFGRNITDLRRRNPRKKGELFKAYYERISRGIGAALNPYMTEPYYLTMKTTGTTGESKWVVHGETFWNNLYAGALTSAVVACSDSWGETKVKDGDKALNVTAPIPHLSGWALWASQTHFQLIPPIEVTDTLHSTRDAFFLILQAIEKGEKIALGGGLGSLFYMICKYFVEPEEFYQEYYQSMKFGLNKSLLFMKLLQLRFSKKKRRKIADFMPLKGVLIGGLDSRLYIEFFKEEFNLEPLNTYGSTEAGNLMRGMPERKADLVPDLTTSYFEFRTEDGHVIGLDEVKRDAVYDLIVTPFGSIFFRYDMKDLFKVIDFRDDGMPIFAFEGREINVLNIYGYKLTPNAATQALSMAGLNASDKWAVTKVLKPKEHLHILMEKTWSYSEREAATHIFNALMEVYGRMANRGRTLRDYVLEAKVKDPSEMIQVEYLKPGAFLRYTMIAAKKGIPLGQYKAPKIISPDKSEIFEALRNA